MKLRDLIKELDSLDKRYKEMEVHVGKDKVALLLDNGNEDNIFYHEVKIL